MKYIWDKNKNKQNIKKHGISFELASKIFLDPNRIEYYDEKHSKNEDRYYTIGLVGEVLFVVYTERNEMIRFITARLADKNEEKQYYNSLKGGKKI